MAGGRFQDGREAGGEKPQMKVAIAKERESVLMGWERDGQESEIVQPRESGTGRVVAEGGSRLDSGTERWEDKRRS